MPISIFWLICGSEMVFKKKCVRKHYLRLLFAAPLVPSQRFWLATVLFVGEALAHPSLITLGVVCMTVDELQTNNGTTNLTDSEEYFRDWNAGQCNRRSRLWRIFRQKKRRNFNPIILCALFAVGAYKWLFNSERENEAFSSSNTCEGDVVGDEGGGGLQVNSIPSKS